MPATPCTITLTIKLKGEVAHMTDNGLAHKLIHQLSNTMQLLLNGSNRLDNHLFLDGIVQTLGGQAIWSERQEELRPIHAAHAEK